MQISNPEHVPMREIHARLSSHYPGATLKKPWLTPEMISIPVDRYRLFVRSDKANKRLTIDYQPPVLWNLMWGFGTVILINVILYLTVPVFAERRAMVLGGLPMLLGFLVGRGVYRGRISQSLHLLRQQVESALSREENSIF